MNAEAGSEQMMVSMTYSLILKEFQFGLFFFFFFLSGEEWHIYWASVGTVKAIFNPESGYRLNDMQYGISVAVYCW
jgi:hypothetical protein